MIQKQQRPVERISANDKTGVFSRAYAAFRNVFSTKKENHSTQKIARENQSSSNQFDEPTLVIPRKSRISNLYEKVGITKSGNSIAQEADDLLKQGKVKEAAELCIDAGRLSLASKLGLHLLEKGMINGNRKMLMDAGNILSKSGGSEFFGMVDEFSKSMNPMHFEIAVELVQSFPEPGLRAVVKYEQLYKLFPSGIFNELTDSEILLYSKKMLLQRKREHAMILGKICERTGRNELAADIYGLLGVQLSRGHAMIKCGKYLEAADLFIKHGMSIEAYDAAKTAQANGALLDAAEIFLKLNDKRSAFLIASALDRFSASKIYSAAAPKIRKAA